MKIITTNNYNEMSKLASNHITKLLLQGEEKKNFALATGNSPTGTYKEYIKNINNGLLKEKVNYLNIDEYYRVDLNAPGTCRRYLKENFCNLINTNENYIFIDEENYTNYDNMIEEMGGLDLTILGIGENGHIAYNEPNTKFNSMTHKQKLTKESKLQHGEEFGGEDLVPDYAITIGIKSIMNSKNIILLASGTKKAEIVKKSLFGEITEEIPASILQLHPNLTVILDKDAANLIESN